MPFITDEDIKVLNEYDIDILEYEKVFIKELKEFLIEVWTDKYHEIINGFDTIEDFNESVEFPSWHSFYLLEDTFLNVDEDIAKILSHKSKNLIKYFYGIELK